MKYVFFIYDKTTDAVALMLTENGEKFLLDNHIIQQGDPTWVMDAENLSEEKLRWVEFVHLLEFKSKTAPTSVGVSKDKATAFFIQILRKRRDELLSSLDNLQLRAFSLGRQEVMQRMEQDKAVLRDIISTRLFDKCETLSEFLLVRPAPLLIDYRAKYESDLAIVQAPQGS